MDELEALLLSVYFVHVGAESSLESESLDQIDT